MSSVNSGYYRKRLQSVRDRSNLNTKWFQTESNPPKPIAIDLYANTVLDQDIWLLLLTRMHDHDGYI